MEDEERSTHSSGSGSERNGPPPNPGLPTPSIAAPVNQHCIKILVATDNHIGYAESDPIRGQDSINTFREILQLAVEHDVDMLLLAGDLFHENRPSRTSLYSTIASLREYCLNSRPIRIELVGDAGIGIPHSFNFPPVNYEDENINVGLPVFSIHGNHDDPQGIGPEGALCALDVLSASGLVNYFGRQELPGTAQTDQEALEQGLHIQPILLQKGRTKLAIYGIGNIRDERFHYEMRSNRIRMSRPAEYRDEWFNLMLVHQNRVAHGPKNSVPENGFGDDVDLLIWGHEHDCLIAPVEVPGKGYYISQPGSSVATSLAKGESLKKHVAILDIQDHDFCMTPIPLKTVRPFVFHDIVLSEVEEDGKEKFEDKPAVIKFLKDEVGKLIDQANAEWDDMHCDEPDAIPRMLPLIRLRVEYTRLDGNGAYEVGNPQRFGQDFLGKVANPKDVVQFYRRKRMGTRKLKNDIDQPEDEVLVDSQGATLKSEKIEVATYVHQYLEAQSLGVLAENGMQHAVNMFVEKDDKDAIKAFYNKALKATQAHVKESQPAETQNRDKDRDEDSEDEELLEHLTRAKEVYAEEWEKKGQREVEKKRAKAAAKASSGRARNDDDSDESDFGKMSDVRRFSPSEEESDASLMPPPKGKGKGAASSKTPARNRREPSDSEASSQASVAPSKKAPAKKSAPPKKAPAEKAPAKKTAAASKSKAGSSQTQTMLNFSQAPPQRGAAVRTGRVGAMEEDSDTLDESEESVQTKRNPKATTSARARR